MIAVGCSLPLAHESAAKRRGRPGLFVGYDIAVIMDSGTVTTEHNISGNYASGINQ